MKSVSVVKHSYISAGGNSKARAKAHLSYIQHRSGHDKDKDGYRKFFDKDHDQVNSGAFKNRVSKAPERGTLMHKFIISPGVHGVDLREYTRQVMEQLGDKKGLDLEWQGIVHTNTDHDHVHVVVLGKDRDGKSVRFTKEDYEFAREVGDRYLERKHEFDRYFDRSLDRLLREEAPYNKDFDLDKLFQPYQDKGKDKSKGGRKKREDKELHRQGAQSAYIKEKRKPRRQRLVEARGRNDYFHDRYVRETRRQELKDLAQARPEMAEYVKEQLEFMAELDRERQQDFKRSPELDRILGIEPARAKTTDKEAAKAKPEQATEAETAGVVDRAPERQDSTELQRASSEPKKDLTPERPAEKPDIDIERQVDESLPEKQEEREEELEHEGPDLQDEKDDHEQLIRQHQEGTEKAHEREREEEEERDLDEDEREEHER